ncbi:MAG: TonB-dependent receptor family protein [Methylophilaceae bacterium]
MQFNYKAIYICLLAASASNAYADHIEKSDTQTLPTVTVTEKKTTTGVSLTQADMQEAIKEINKTAGGVTVVDLERVREGRVSNFNDTLGMATGVFAQSRFGAEESRLSIRGSGLQRTFHGRGIQLMQDGIPVNLADGSFDFQAIEPLSTRYIEVFRGANAMRFGSSNLGGAINFVSPTGYDAPQLEARAEFGSFGYRRFGLATGGVVGNLDYFVSTSTFDQDGFRDNAQQSAERTNANIGYRFNENVETRFFLGYANSNSELPGNLTKAQLKDDPSQAILSATTGQQRRNIDVWRIANKTTILLDNGRLELGGYYSDKTLFHPIFQILDQDSQDYGLSVRLVQEGKLFGLRNEFITGYTPSYGETEETRWQNLQGSRGVMRNKTKQVASNNVLYAENRLFVLPDLALVTGLQYTNSKRELNDKFITGTEGDESFNTRYVQTSPKIGLLYQYTSQIQVYGNVSRSYEPPSFGELAGGLRPNIVSAQGGTTFEIGSRGNSTNVDWDISAYYAKLQDELLQTAVFVAGNSATPASQTTNASHTIHAGIEMGMTARLPGNLEWRHNLLINEFRFDNDDVYGNRNLAGVPKSLLRGELLYRKNGFYTGPTIETSPQRYAADFAETIYADSYTIFGWKMGQQINKQVSWFIEGRNLTAVNYAATTGVVRALNTTPGPNNNEALFLPGDSRSVYAGMQWRY